MDRKMISASLKKNAMLIVLVLVYVFFLILTKGGIFKPSSFVRISFPRIPGRLRRHPPCGTSPALPPSPLE